MSKKEYLDELRSKLEAVHSNNVDSMIEYYEEMINDRMEDGMDEETAVADMESVDDIIEQTIADMPMPDVIKAKVQKSHSKAKLKGLEWLWITLLIIGFPVWFPIILTFAILIATFYFVAWVLIFSIFVIEVSFGISAIAGIITAGAAFTGAVPYISIIPALGVALLAGGLAVLLWNPVVFLAKELAKLPAKAVKGIKRLVM